MRLSEAKIPFHKRSLKRALQNKGDKNMKLSSRLWKDTRGQDLVEYALAAGMVALAAVAAMPQLTGVINNVFSAIGSLINSSVA
jgi:pilus assembly protein Flp/PilA